MLYVCPKYGKDVFYFCIELTTCYLIKFVIGKRMNMEPQSHFKF